jgi:hypothetical protein
MTVLDDWSNWIQSQVNAAEQWAQQNPLTVSVVIVVISGAVIVVGSKAADILLGR